MRKEPVTKWIKSISLKIMVQVALAGMIITSCQIQRVSMFKPDAFNTSETKADIIKKYGEPYKQSTTLENGVTTQRLFYKEHLYVGNSLGSRWYEVNTIVVLKNGVYAGLEQGKETPTEGTVTVDSGKAN